MNAEGMSMEGHDSLHKDHDSVLLLMGDSDVDTVGGAAVPSLAVLHAAEVELKAEAERLACDSRVLQISHEIPYVPFSRSSCRRVYVLDENFFPDELKVSNNELSHSSQSELRSFFQSNPSTTASGAHFLLVLRSTFGARLRGLVGLQNLWRKRATFILCLATGCFLAAFNILKDGQFDNPVAVGFSVLLIICSVVAVICFYPVKLRQLKAMRNLAQPYTVCGHLAGCGAAALAEGQIISAPRGRTWHAEVRIVLQEGRCWRLRLGATALFEVWWRNCNDCGCNCSANNQVHPLPVALPICEPKLSESANAFQSQASTAAE